MSKKSKKELVERGAQQRSAVNARSAKPGAREARSADMRANWARMRAAALPPADLLQGLAAHVKGRFVAETGLEGKLALELRIPEVPEGGGTFAVEVIAIHKASGERRAFTIEVEARPVLAS
jgi:hypothetical protein